MKRCGKIIIMSLLFIFVLTVPVFAREMTPDELGTEAKSKIPNTSYLYVIGEYAFTSEHTLTTQDVMLAARSINAKDTTGKLGTDTIYNEMTIFTLKAKYNDQVELTGWQLSNNLVGTSKLEDLPNGKFNVKYIDYQYVKDLYTVDFDLGGGKFADGKTSIKVLENDKITEADITGENRPTLDGKQFKEWVKEDDSTPWDFSQPVKGNMKLKATWYEEVNTDNLIESAKKVINEGTKDNGYYYDVDFINETKTIKFNVYDLNKQNSKIAGTGLLGDIVGIVKNKDVVSIAISNGTENIVFGKDDVSDGAGSSSKAWQQFAVLLCKLTGKQGIDYDKLGDSDEGGQQAKAKLQEEFDKITLGDLLKLENLTLTINLNDKTARSQNYKDKEEYKIEFGYDAKATVAIPANSEDLKDFNYTLQNTYQIAEKDGVYNVTGYITKQDEVTGFGAKPTGFYFAYTISLGDGVDATNAKVKVPTDSTGEKYNEEKFDATKKTVTVLMEVDESEVGDTAVNGYRDVIVEVNGVPTKIRINFSELKLKDDSKSTVEKVEETGKQKLKSGYNWDEPANYDVTYEEVGNTIKVKGLLPIYNEKEDSKLPFGDGHKTGYYIAFAIKTKDKKTEKTTVKIKDGTEEFTWKGTDFDDDNNIYILKHIHKDATTKTFTIEVDLDGEGEETKYKPYTITVDWSDLKLQEVSAGNVENYEVATRENISGDQQALEDLESFEYNYETSKDVILKMEGAGQTKKGITGTIREQTLKEAFVNNTGYFVPIKVEFPGKGNANLNDYSNKWTITLNTEKGETKTYTPTVDEYKQGWVLVLFRIEKDGKDGKHEISYKIDFDGSENAYLPQEYTIDYTDLKFAEAHKVEFKGVEAEPVTVWDGDKITADMLPETNPAAVDNYHEFAYWNKEDGTKFDSIEFTYEGDEEAGSKETGDITLVPHWNLYSDKFVSDVIKDLNKTENSQSEDFSKEFVIEDYEENSGKVTIKVIDPTIPMSRMDETSIPGAIAYTLLKDEITEITLSINGSEKIFTKDGMTDQGLLKDKIKQGAKDFYKDILNAQFDGKDGDTVTLSELAHKEKYNSFKLRFNADDLPKTVTLKKTSEASGISLASTVDVPTEYEFKFESDTVVVDSESKLNAALQGAAKRIFISKGFTVENTVNIGRNVVIDGNNKQTITAGSKVTNIFNVTEGDVTINNIKLKDAETPILVTKGNVTVTDLVIEGEKATKAIEVKDNASLNLSKLTFDGESYKQPAVITGKTNATVKFKDSTEKDAAKVTTMEKIVTYEEQEPKNGSYGDKKEEIEGYAYYNYYNKPENSKIYKTTFHNHEGREFATFERYNYYGESVKEPDKTDFDVFTSFNYNAETYTLIGYAENRDNTVNFDYSGELPAGVIDGSKITATEDKYYYAAYSVKLRTGVKKITTADELKNAIEDGITNEIYIDTTKELDLSTTDIDINRKISIVGPAQKVKLKVKSIKVTADNVFLHRLDIEVNTSAETETQPSALIDVSGNASKFTLWQCSLKNTGNAKINNAIKYSGTKATVDVRWNTIYADNINNTLLNIDSNLAEVTDIYGNTFKKISGEDSKKSAIIIKSFDETAKIKDDDETIRIAANTFDKDDYAIEILKDASGKEADISLQTSQDIVIAVGYDETSNQFGSINIHPENVDKITVRYIDSSRSEKERLESGTGLKMMAQMGV